MRVGDGVGATGSAIVQLNAANQVINSSAISIYSDGILRVQGNNETVGAVTLFGGSITGSATLGLGGTLTFGVSGTTAGNIDANLALNASRIFNIGNNTNQATDLSINGSLSDGAAPSTITKTGTGTVLFAGANTFTGGLLINAGTLLARSNAALGTAAVQLGDTTGNTAATLLFSNTSGLTISNAISARTGSSGTLIIGGQNTSGVNTLTGVIALGRTVTFTAATGGQVDLNGVVSGAGGLTKTGGGTVRLGNTSTYSGATSVTAGTFAAGAVGSFSASSAMSISSGAILDLQGFNNIVASLAGAGMVALGGSILTAGGNNATTTFSGVLSGLGGLTKNGTGILTLSGINTYTGATRINAGTLRFGSNNALSSSSANVTLAASSTLDLANFSGALGSLAGTGTVQTGSSGTNTLTVGGNNNSTTFSGSIQGAAALVKTGTGALRISSSTSVFSGGTTISGGTIELTGTLNSTSGITVRNSGTLSGTGSTTRPVTVQAGGTLSAGVTGAGKLSTGNLNLLASTSIFVEIGGATASQIDQIEVTGSVTLGGNVTISLINGYRPDPSLYGLPGFIPGGANIALPKFFAILNDGTDAIVGQFANQVSSANLFNGTPLISFDGVTYAISYTGNSATNSFTGGNDLVFLAVPEPSSTLAILTGGLLFFSTRLRRNRRWR